MPDPAPATQLEALFKEYDELAEDVAGSAYQLFPGNLKRWLHFLDTAGPFARPIVQQLEPSIHFDTWFAPYKAALQGSHVSAFEWPPEKYRRLGAQLLLFRQWTTGGMDPKLFAFLVLKSGPNVKEGNTALIHQVFVPASRELRRFLAQVAEPLPAVTTILDYDAVLTSETHPSSLGDITVNQLVPKTDASVELITLKPTFMGMSINLNEALRRFKVWRKGH